MFTLSGQEKIIDFTLALDNVCVLHLCSQRLERLSTFAATHLIQTSSIGADGLCPLLVMLNVQESPSSNPIQKDLFHIPMTGLDGHKIIGVLEQSFQSESWLLSIRYDRS